MASNETLKSTSTRTTGNDPVSGVDPGGTHPTKPGQPDKSAPKKDNASVEQSVQTGDRNEMTEARGPMPKQP